MPELHDANDREDLSPRAGQDCAAADGDLLSEPQDPFSAGCQDDWDAMETADKKYVNTRVASAVWSTAQQWECEFWIREQRNLAKHGKNQVWKFLSLFGVVEKYRGDDDNRWWAKCFDNYQFLPSTVENMIEVGCGPYTNARLVRTACQPRHLVLSDPLMRTYVDFNMTFVHEMSRTAGAYLDDHPLEDLPFKDECFDVVLMMNFLDHVQDADACMRTLFRIAKPGAHIVIGQDLTDEEDFRTHQAGMRTGHPVTLDADWFQSYLGTAFRPVVNRVLPREEGRTPQWHHATLLYAGVKLPERVGRP
jgi:SAM-dependent methyltransferase